MNNQTIAKFKLAKALAYFEGAWRACSHGECIKRRTCTGGPRGTCAKTVGQPRCAAEKEPLRPGHACLEQKRHRDDSRRDNQQATKGCLFNS